MKNDTHGFIPICGEDQRLTERGQSLGEYLIIVAIIAVGVLIAVRQFGSGVSEKVSGAAEMVASARDEQREDVVRESPGGAREEKGRRSEEFDSSGSHSRRMADSPDSSESLRAEGVGEKSYVPVDEIRLSWSTILLIGAGIVAVGVITVLAMKSRIKNRGGKRKKKGLREAKQKQQKGL